MRSEKELTGLNRSLYEAIDKSDVEGVTKALGAGAEINADYERVTTPLMFALLNNEVAAAKILIEKGADVNAVHQHKDSFSDKITWEVAPLSIAAGKNAIEMVGLLIEKGANVNHRSNYNFGFHKDNQETNSAFINAVAKGNIDIVKLLLEKDTQLTEHDLFRGMQLACMGDLRPLENYAHGNPGHVEIAKLLMEKGVDINAKFKLDSAIKAHALDLVWDEIDFLTIAAKTKNAGMVKHLIDSGANVETAYRYRGDGFVGGRYDRKRDGGITATITAARMKDVDLSWAIDNRDKLMADMFIKQGIKPEVINAKNEKGETPLIQAIKFNKLTIANMLLEVPGIDFSIKDNEGKTALDYSREQVSHYYSEKTETPTENFKILIHLEREEAVREALEKAAVKLLEEQGKPEGMKKGSAERVEEVRAPGQEQNKGLK